MQAAKAAIRKEQAWLIVIAPRIIEECPLELRGCSRWVLGAAAENETSDSAPKQLVVIARISVRHRWRSRASLVFAIWI